MRRMPWALGDPWRERDRQEITTRKITTVSSSEPQEQVLWKCLSRWKKHGTQKDSQFCIAHTSAKALKGIRDV